jgi:hypothetical protein
MSKSRVEVIESYRVRLREYAKVARSASQAELGTSAGTAKVRLQKSWFLPLFKQ